MPAASAVVSESDEEEGSDLDEEPTDEQLLEAIRAIPASVDDISQLSLKQVCTVYTLVLYGSAAAASVNWCTCCRAE